MNELCTQSLCSQYIRTEQVVLVNKLVKRENFLLKFRSSLTEGISFSIFMYMQASVALNGCHVLGTTVLVPASSLLSHSHKQHDLSPLISQTDYLKRIISLYLTYNDYLKRIILIIKCLNNYEQFYLIISWHLLYRRKAWSAHATSPCLFVNAANGLGWLAKSINLSYIVQHIHFSEFFYFFSMAS